MKPLTFTIADYPAIDVPTEAQRSFDAISTALNDAGLALSDVLKMRLFYDERHDFPAMNTIRDPLFRSTYANNAFPASTGVCTGGSGEEGAARFSVEVIAAPGKRAAVSPEVVSRFGDVVPPFSHVNEAGDVAFLAGQGAFDVTGNFTGTGPADEARKALATFAPILSEVGRTVEDIVSVVVYLTPAASAAGPRWEIAEIVDDFLSSFAVRPVVSIIPVADLAFEGMTVEIEAIAGAPGAEHLAVQTTLARNALNINLSCAQALRSGSLVVASVTAVDLAAASSRMEAIIAEIGGGLAPGALVTVWYPHAEGRPALRAATVAIDGVDQPQINYVPFPAEARAGVVTMELLANADENLPKG